MKIRRLIAATAVAGLALTALAACGDDSDDKTLKVWLMRNSLPESIVDDVKKEFEDSHDGWKVKVEYQEWTDITRTLDKGLGSNNPPDVVEIGNTLTTGLAAAGALEDLTDKTRDLKGEDWNPAMTETGTYDEKLYGVPYYGGARVVLYRKDLFAASNVQVPTTMAELTTASEQLMADNVGTTDFSAIYIPGRYWYFGTSFVFNSGGEIAAKEGDDWKSQLATAESVNGITAYKEFADTVSPNAPKEVNEEDPPQVNLLGDGKSAMIYGFGWMIGEVEKAHPELKDQIGIFTLPGDTAGSAFPTFLGGSNLGIAAGSDKKDEAYDFLKLLTVDYQERLVNEAKLIPNNMTMLETAKQDPVLAPSANAASNGWVTPSSPKWSEVESAQVMQDLYQAVLSGQKSPQAAADDASARINEILNKQ